MDNQKAYFPPSELVLNDKNEVYHLGLNPSEIADKIILVGDQGRVEEVAVFFDSVEVNKQHREFHTITGTYQGKRITVLSTGIGTDNIDIVINELDALVNIDLDSRTEKSEKKSLEIIRIGTCGILNASIPVHSYILSQYALGIDNVAHFYQLNFDADEMELLNELTLKLSFPKQIYPYLIKSSNRIFSKLNDNELIHKGITITSSGFYGPQGRRLRLPLQSESLNDEMEQFTSSNGIEIANYEMESSALFALGKGLSHHCGTICLGIANRPLNEFSKGYKEEMKGLIQFVLDRF
jgi:uridine phosphorylase